MKVQKLSIALLLVLTFSLLSVAFVQGQDTVEMQVAWWGSQNRHDRTIQAIELFKAANPGVEIVYEFAVFADYWTLMNTKAAGEQLPCVMQQDYAFLREWQSRGLLMPLDPYIESGVLDVSDVDASLLAGGMVGDENYAISLGSNSQSIILDVDAFEAAGLELPAPDWTWEDFEQTIMTIHEQTGKWGINYGGEGITDIQFWKAVNLGHGMLPTNEEGTALGITDWQPTIDFFNMVIRLQNAGALPTGEEAAEFVGVPLESAPIVTEHTAMQYQWSNQVVAIYSGAGEERNFKLWHLPRPEGGQPSNYLKPSQFFSITSNCETPELAAQFISFFTNDLQANEALFAERGVPISAAVREHLRPMLDAAGAETFDYLERVTADSSPLPPPDPPNWANFVNNVYSPLVRDPLLFQQITPEEAVAILEQDGNAVLAEGS